MGISSKLLSYPLAGAAGGALAGSLSKPSDIEGSSQRGLGLAGGALIGSEALGYPMLRRLMSSGSLSAVGKNTRLLMLASILGHVGGGVAGYYGVDKLQRMHKNALDTTLLKPFRNPETVPNLLSHIPFMGSTSQTIRDTIMNSLHPEMLTLAGMRKNFLYPIAKEQGFNSSGTYMRSLASKMQTPSSAGGVLRRAIDISKPILTDYPQHFANYYNKVNPNNPINIDYARGGINTIMIPFANKLRRSSYLLDAGGIIANILRG